MHKGGILILDFGSQVTQLIARRIRELSVYCEIVPFNAPLAEIQKREPRGIILSGGPNSVYDTNAPTLDLEPLKTMAPLLGICYGMQLLAHKLGGQVTGAQEREYGYSEVKWSLPPAPQKAPKLESFLKSMPNPQKVWMSHGDIVQKIPPGWHAFGHSANGHFSGMMSPDERFWGLQFHPEVSHTLLGEKWIAFFVNTVCGITPNWEPAQIEKELIEQVKNQVGEGRVLCALSGGVDSSVVAALLTKALGPKQVQCVFVDTGLLRKNEFTSVLAAYQELGLSVIGVEAKSEFLTALAGEADPEKKRKTIGRLFIEVFEREIQKLKSEGKGHFDFLAQGTLYPDVIESVSPTGGPSQSIKSHHNVGGLPANLKLKLVEPLRELFKDEVRTLGRRLGLPEPIVGRHPFPGPGLAIRVIGAVSEESLSILREADAVYIQALRDYGLYDKIWQAFCVLLPVKTVGVQGDGRTYDFTLALRAVTSSDGMTADWYAFEADFMRYVSGEITSRVRGVNRVVYDITSKPPATIEWE